MESDAPECLIWIGRINGELWRFEKLEDDFDLADGPEADIEVP